MWTISLMINFFSTASCEITLGSDALFLLHYSVSMEKGSSTSLRKLKNFYLSALRITSGSNLLLATDTCF